MIFDIWMKYKWVHVTLDYKDRPHEDQCALVEVYAERERSLCGAAANFIVDKAPSASKGGLSLSAIVGKRTKTREQAWRVLGWRFIPSQLPHYAY